MKIALVGTTYPFRGGLAAFNERLAREFQKEGHEVKIYTFTLQYPSFLFPGKTQFSTESAPEGLPIERCINSINPINWLHAGRKIAKGGHDAVIFCYWMSFMSPCFGTIARQIRKTGNTKCLSLVHNMMPHEPSILDRILPSFFVHSMQGFIAMSQSVLSEIALLEKKNTPKAFSPHPIYDHFGERLSREKALENLQLDSSFRYVLFFGLIRTYKGLDILLDAFADKRLHNYPIKLLVAGEFYDDKQPYLDQITNYGLSDKVILRDEYIPDSEVANYFSATDIVAQPYRSASQSGISQIAYHFEKPMLVSNVGGLAEIVPHGKVGYVVQPNAKETADALVDFFSNHQPAEFEKNVEKEKGKYAWGKMTKVISDLILTIPTEASKQK
jgi:glycosyltransferase involved in cell wall biosynthesis